MSKKFFTLIHGDTVHVAPKTKVIPAEAFSVLMDASGVLEQIKKDAEQYRQEVVKECEQIKEHAFKEGYEAGYKEWAEHLARLEQEIEKVHAEVQKLVIPVALTAAKKIVARELESSDAIVDIVASNLKAVSQHKKVTIYISKKDLDVVEKNRQRLRDMFEGLESLSIREKDDLEPGSCTIETEIGIINGRLEHRWKVLEKAFEAAASKPTTPAETKTS